MRSPRRIGTVGTILAWASMLGAPALPGCGGDRRPSWQQGLPYAEPRAVVGRVVGIPGFDPLVGASVRLVTDGNEFTMGTTTTDAEGNFRFTDLDDPNYYLIVEHPDYLTDKFITFTGKGPEWLKVTHKSQSPHLRWEPGAPIEPAMEALVGEAVVEKRPLARELGRLRGEAAFLRREWDTADEGSSSHGSVTEIAARLRAVEALIPPARTECVRAMIEQAAAETSDPRLVRAAKWIAEFRVVEQRFAASKAAMDAARAAKQAGTGSKDEYTAAFEAWSTIAREWREWRDGSAAVLDPAKRALMAIRAKQSGD